MIIIEQFLGCSILFQTSQYLEQGIEFEIIE